MNNIIIKINKGFNIIRRRLQDQGFRTTLLWLYARGLPALTGIPILRFSRVTPSLFVGPQFKKPGLLHLQRHGIHAVINMRIEFDDAEFGLAPNRYLHLPTVDDDAPSREHLIRGVEFIEDAVKSGHKVYIHCGAGVGRAPTMAAAYLISKGIPLNQALQRIQAVRPFIYLMPPQIKLLLWYENHCSQPSALPNNPSGGA
jgi:protein-tyrosine phosphatase